MKKKLTKKLSLNKENISSLNPDEMDSTKGGATFYDCITIGCTFGCTISCSVIAPCCIIKK